MDMEQKEYPRLEAIKEELKKYLQEETVQEVTEKIKSQLDEMKKSFITMDEFQRALADKRVNMMNGDGMEDAVRFYRAIGEGKIKDVGLADNSGSILIPSSVAKMIMSEMKEYWLRREATVFPDGKGIMFYAGDGPTAQRVPIGEAPVESNPTINAIPYEEFDVVAVVPVGNRILEKANPDIVSYLNREFAKAFANLEEREFILGNPTQSVKEFQGCYATDIPIVQGDKTAVDDLVYDDFLKLYLSVPQAYRSKSVWVISPEVEEVAMRLKDNYGHPLFNPDDGKIMGKPYFVSPYLVSDASNPIMYFGYLKEFFIFDEGRYQLLVTREGKELVTKRLTLMVMIGYTDGKWVTTKHIRGYKLMV